MRAIGIDLQCKVIAALVQRKGTQPEFSVSSDTPDSHGLAKTSALFALRHLGQRGFPKGYTINLRIESKIPSAVGLKSSSAISTAIVKSVLSLFGRQSDPKTILDLSCSASKNCGASITGAYDDASASLLGGLVLTNNTRFEIVKHERVPASLGTTVLVLVPINAKKFTSSVNTHIYSRFKKESAPSL